jgi:hypothetical protein
MTTRSLTSKQRNLLLYHHIDPGFINLRLCHSFLPPEYLEEFNKIRVKEDDHWAKLANDHYLVDTVLILCKNAGVKTLSETLIEGATVGQVFCSTESFKGAGKKVYDKGFRVRNQVNLSFKFDKKVFAEYSTNHFVADTGKLEQSKKSICSIVGTIREITENEIIVYPLIIGAPSFDHSWNQNKGIGSIALMWTGWDFFEIFPEDIDEFSNITSCPEIEDGEWIDYMSKKSESEIKEKFCELLKELPSKDWGGELNDLFTGHIHQSGRKTSAAFVLKGPSKFVEMKMTHLGKNADQIFRLAQSPARLLIIQHSHAIGEAVRATMRAFAVSPHDPRHYCFIDGRDTYKILKAYDKLN